MERVDYTNSRGILTTKRADGTVRTDHLYRISLKALIYNDAGQLLVTREHGLDWHLPGGGLDYGESIKEGLTRELHEEVGYEGKLTYEVIGADLMWISNLDVYQLWLVAVVKPQNHDFSIGVDGGGVRFIDPEELAQSDARTSQLSYQFHELAQKNRSKDA